MTFGFYNSVNQLWKKSECSHIIKHRACPKTITIFRSTQKKSTENKSSTQILKVTIHPEKVNTVYNKAGLTTSVWICVIKTVCFTPATSPCTCETPSHWSASRCVRPREKNRWLDPHELPGSLNRKHLSKTTKTEKRRGYNQLLV